MEKEEQRALDCMVMHLRTFFCQAAEGRTADFGEPCERCKWGMGCNYDWINIMNPLLKQSQVDVSVLQIKVLGIDLNKKTEKDLETFCKVRDYSLPASVFSTVALIFSVIALCNCLNIL